MALPAQNGSIFCAASVPRLVALGSSLGVRGALEWMVVRHGVFRPSLRRPGAGRHSPPKAGPPSGALGDHQCDSIFAAAGLGRSRVKVTSVEHKNATFARRAALCALSLIAPDGIHFTTPHVHASDPELARALQTLTARGLLRLDAHPSLHQVVETGVLDSEVAFLQKPFTPESLTRKVRDVLNATH